MAKSGLIKRALGGWDSAAFWALSTPEQNPALGVLSTPAHTQVTQTVRRLALHIEHSLLEKEIVYA
jgi:hypothetical protein